MDKKEMANMVIDRLGGTSAVARLCECKTPSVSDWRKNGIPKARMQYLRAIKPDVFDGLVAGNENGNQANRPA